MQDFLFNFAVPGFFFVVFFFLQLVNIFILRITWLKGKSRTVTPSYLRVEGQLFQHRVPSALNI